MTTRRRGTAFKANPDGANRGIAKASYTITERLNEIPGGLATEAKTFIKIYFYKEHCLLMGDDNGFSSKNYDSFYETYNSDFGS